MVRNRGMLFVPVLVACGSVQNTPGAVDAALDSPGAMPKIVATNTVSRADLVTGIEPLVIPAGKTYVIDTDQGSMYDAGNSNAPLRVAGGGVKNGIFYRTDLLNRAFFAVQSLTIGENAILRGVGGRALILIADGPVEIHGLIDVSAGHCSPTTDGSACPGPGAGRGNEDANLAGGCSPGQPGVGTTGASGGGGGGGYASPGGAGGAASASVAGGAGGSGANCPGQGLDPLQGGSGGSRGAGSGAGAGGKSIGGGGGGAVQVTSYTSIALVSPTTPNTCGVWAGGAGGTGGEPGGTSPLAGSGGGSGGAIVLEATSVQIAPRVVLAANGGGGGAGAQTMDGAPGQFGSTPASGGVATTGVSGGAGAALNTNASNGILGATTQTSSPGGGGGGGGVGRIRINAVTLTLLSPEAVLSPSPSLNVPAPAE